MAASYFHHSRLRAELAEARAELRGAEAELAELSGEIHAFEADVDARLGTLLDQLAALGDEVQTLNDEIQRIRDRRLFGERQYTYYSGAPRPGGRPPPAPQPRIERSAPETGQLQPAGGAATLKQLYRQLARRYHPDLAIGDADRSLRTEKMTEINQAYAAGNLAVLQALAGIVSAPSTPSQAPAESPRGGEALDAELARVQRRLREVRAQIEELHRLPSVQLSLEVKLAARRSHDLLGEMAKDLTRKVARKEAERDFLKSQVKEMQRHQP